MSLTAIKQNEPAAVRRRHQPVALENAGPDRERRRMAAAAGGLYAVVLLVVTPQTMFGALVSAQALIMALFGGVGMFWGPVIGAAVLVPLAETLNAQLGNVLPGIQGVVYGVAIIVITLLAPEGIYWRVRDRFTSRRAARVPAPSTAPAPWRSPACRRAAANPRHPSGRWRQHSCRLDGDIARVRRAQGRRRRRP